MALPTPHLDDRRFQDLVDDAKRLIQQRCPEWTDHNVSDPGVTLVEAFAGMTEQLLYRLNRVPEKLHVAFLELLGVQLFPPTAARVQQTFWLSAAQESAVVVPVDTAVGTRRTPTEESVVFTTVRDLRLEPTSLLTCRTRTPDDEAGKDHGRTLARGGTFPAFAAAPSPGDEVLFGLTGGPVAGLAVALSVVCRVEGIGIDPEDPPLVWEAAGPGTTWLPCRLEHDGTGGLNVSGDVVLHVPDGHTATVVAGRRASWLRARLVAAREGQPQYSSAPRLSDVSASTVGGSVEVVQAERVVQEVLGVSEGVPAQAWQVLRPPVVPGTGTAVLEVTEPDSPADWVPWTRVGSFGLSGPDDRHWVLDPVSGEVRLGPVVRQADGSLVQHGRVPPAGSGLRLRDYLTGGGARGNVAPGTLDTLLSSVPFVARTSNRRAASGGRDGEELANAQVRSPGVLSTRGRAVTAGDFEHLARTAAPEVARVRAVAVDDDGGGVRVLVVPAVAEVDGRLDFSQLVPDDATLARIAEVLAGARLLGTRIVVEPPVYQGLTVVGRVRARPGWPVADVRAGVLDALHDWFSPIDGGPDGEGWPFGRPANIGEVYAVLQRVPGVDLVEDARLFPADPVTGRRGESSQRVDLDVNALAFSYDHQVRVTS